MMNLIDMICMREPNSKKSDILKRIESGEIALGKVWENVLTDNMKHTSYIGKNSIGRDWLDGTDGKFSMAMFDKNNSYYASIGGVKNKIGTLRVCICDKLDNYKLYFMLIPKSEYSRWISGSPCKLAFKNGQPAGKNWDKFRKYLCTFRQVCKKIN